VTAAAQSLLSAAAVRERAHEMLRLAVDGGVPEWRVDQDRLPTLADGVARVIRERYPALDVPFHARWRHFVSGGRDLWGAVQAEAAWSDAADRARSEFDLAIVSVLLDAGAGSAWSYHDAATGSTIGRSEGLAIASLRQFQGGSFSGNPRRPLRADAVVLKGLSADTLASGFQARDGNRLIGLETRARLLRRLGEQALARPDLFGEDSPRPGGLFDALAARASGGVLAAPLILELLLEALGPIWEGRLALDGQPLGDTWRHPAIHRDDATNGLVPLHKLSQWLAYSLIEPLERADISVAEINGLTGLAEYRNGGLFVDHGVLVPTDPAALGATHPVDAPLIVAWRSLTVALLDDLAPLVRERLGLTAEAFPLAKLLEGGTWAAGRLAASERRPGGGPPFNIISDGTVF
jgi:hypothetical protein